MVRLRKQARHCNFGTSLNDNLRDQLIELLTDFELKRTLLEHRNITLEEALDKARAWEAAGRQATNMTVNPVAQSGNYATGGKPDQRSRDSDRRQSYNADFVGDQSASDSEENCAFPFAVTENQGETCNVSRLKEPVLELNINGITTRVLIDSGSVRNLIGMEEYEELKAQGLNAKMEDCDKLLYAYGGRQLEVIGHVKVEISVGDKRIGSHLVVTKSGRCLLGHETSQALSLLCTSSSVSSQFVECNVVGENLALVLQAKYPTVFVGVGKLKDYKLKLHIDSKVTPVAQKPRRVPFARGEKVTAKVEDLIAKDIVERVNGPTS
ncbi:hypothetical protein AWC38_SpisGene22772 [Stylophora pistillata]|uniref:Uncharacterized protein n=1 Tax=Stylophora pistillata TaxID=50429 RepID=A0A2B4R6A1_STYPI|nr:hypothetical protein AWC38_SpisGene22772 [Stylophora pistillata]